jgi:dipeptidyl aminopeptidase/acylaminoacyl peptidase
LFPDENHWILKPANAERWYNEVFAWMKQHTAK